MSDGDSTISVQQDLNISLNLLSPMTGLPTFPVILLEKQGERSGCCCCSTTTLGGGPFS